MPTLIDLSHPIVDGQAAYPGDPEPRLVPHATIAGQEYNLARISFGTHQGTHVDAPRHIFEAGMSVDRIPLDRFYGPATLVDLAPRRRLPPRTPITLELLRSHSAAFRRGSRILLRTGWDRLFGRTEYFEEHPVLTPDAAEWMAERQIALLGMDTPSPEGHGLECHRILLREGREIVIVEGLCNLHRLPRRFTFIGFPLRLEGLDGSPIRAVAVGR